MVNNPKRKSVKKPKNMRTEKKRGKIKIKSRFNTVAEAHKRTFSRKLKSKKKKKEVINYG